MPMSSSVAPPASPSHPPIAAKPRLLFIIALRAVASVIILWHHFALYPPLSDWASPLAGHVLDWFEVNARATQVFFVVGGYVMARSLSRHSWNLRQVGSFVAQRYCRLGLPYLAIVLLIIPIYLLARGGTSSRSSCWALRRSRCRCSGRMSRVSRP